MSELTAAQNKLVHYRLCRTGTFELLEYERNMALLVQTPQKPALTLFSLPQSVLCWSMP